MKLWIAFVAVLSFAVCGLAAESKKEEPKADASGKPEPQPVGDEAKLLMKKVTLELVDVPLGDACDFLAQLIGLKVAVSQGAAEKPVTLKLNNATVAEALRQIKDQAGALHRVVDGEVRLATADEFAAIDAGKAKFKKWEPKDEQTLPIVKPRADEKKQGTDVQIDKFALTEASGDLSAEPSTATSVKLARKYTVNGKEYTLEELKTQFPEAYKVLVKIGDGMVKPKNDETPPLKEPEPKPRADDKKQGSEKPAGALRQFRVNGQDYSEKEFAEQFPEFHARLLDNLKNPGSFAVSAANVVAVGPHTTRISLLDPSAQELLKETAKTGGSIQIQVTSDRPGEYIVNGKSYTAEQFKKEFPALSKSVIVASGADDQPLMTDDSKRAYKVDGTTVSEGELKRTDPKVHRLLKAQEEQ